ncbi:MAG: hypothetical protein V1911_04185 [Candidatus Micrarchaeota archaeon]
MKHSIKVGLSFGLTSGVITTLGVMVGLTASVGTKLAVFGGILTVAIADACSDSLGIHISEESEKRHTQKQVWQSTFATFFTKFLVAFSFLGIIMLFSLNDALLAGTAWGLALIGTFSYYIGKENGNGVVRVVSEHITIAVVVIAVAYIVGDWVRTAFV